MTADCMPGPPPPLSPPHALIIMVCIVEVQWPQGGIVQRLARHSLGTPREGMLAQTIQEESRLALIFHNN